MRVIHPNLFLLIIEPPIFQSEWMNSVWLCSSWWSDQKDPVFLSEELSQVFNFGQNSSIIQSRSCFQT